MMKWEYHLQTHTPATRSRGKYLCIHFAIPVRGAEGYLFHDVLRLSLS